MQFESNKTKPNDRKITINVAILTKDEYINKRWFSASRDC